MDCQLGLFPACIAANKVRKRLLYAALTLKVSYPKQLPGGGIKLAGQISLKQLAPAVDQAVKAALQRHATRASNGFAINPGIIAGPILEGAVDFKVAQQIATEVTQHVQKAQVGGIGPALEPAVLFIHGHIICGFYPFPVPEVFVHE